MNVQLSLFDDLPALPGSPSQPPPSPNSGRPLVSSGGPRKPQRGDHNVFFGAVPPPRVRDEITARWGILSSELGLKQQLRQSTLHMSIYGLGFIRTVDTRFVDVFRDAADRIAFTPFDVMFTGTANFGGGAFVLTTDEGRCEPLQALAESLRFNLSEVGFKVPGRLQTIKPHITLAYTSNAAERAIEPLKWTVNSITLIDSVYGYGVHNPLGHWPFAH